MAVDDILASSFVLVSCLEKEKRTINRNVQKGLDMEQFHRFRAVFVKEDRKTGKVVQKLCFFMRQSRSVRLDSHSICKLMSRDKIAGVTSV